MQKVFWISAIFVGVVLGNVYASAAELGTLASDNFTIAAAIPAPGYCDDRDNSRLEESFRRSEMEFNRWYEEYRRAPSGSFEEQRARRMCDEEMRRMNDLFFYEQEVMWTSTATLERLTTNSYERYRYAPAGSLLETYYRTAMQGFSRGFQRKQENVFACAIQYEALNFFESVAQRHYDAYRYAAAGSLIEAFYRESAQRAFRYGERKVIEMRRDYRVDFNTFDRMFMDYYNRYRYAAAGSLIEGYFRNVMTSSGEGSKELLRARGYQMGRYELQRILDENNARYRSAPAGSYLERYADELRRLAASILDQVPN